MMGTRRWMLAGAVALLLMATAAQAVAAEAIAWGQTVAWLGFDTALARAKAENKAIGVVVYADWCPKCRALAPQFVSGPVTEAAPKILWVLQNHDEAPAWLGERFGDLGNYVPRIFFLRPDGSLDREINSGHPRYPFFYLANKPEVLVQSIERAAATAGPAVPAAPPAPPPQVAVAPVPPPPAAQSASRFDLGGDLPLLGLLVVVAVGAVWAVGRGGSKDDEGEA
ncbi:MAG: thioredoxin family protein [Deltaproteobacteria bacterium]|nr:thioredoxin family protein [Deltaproteobacteria bacterium]